LWTAQFCYSGESQSICPSYFWWISLLDKPILWFNKKYHSNIGLRDVYRTYAIPLCISWKKLNSTESPMAQLAIFYWLIEIFFFFFSDHLYSHFELYRAVTSQRFVGEKKFICQPHPQFTTKTNTNTINKAREGWKFWFEASQSQTSQS